MLQFDDSTWWIRTRNNDNNGVYVFNTAQKKFTAHYYVRQCETCTPLRLFDIYITKNKSIYVAPYANGLYKFNPEKNMFNPVFIYNLPKQLIGNSFDCITEDSKGMIWVGTLNGLFVFNPKNNTLIKDYSTNNKIGGVEILKLCFDDDDNLWMTTGRGMFCMEHTTGEILQFNAGDGLPSSNIPGFLKNGNDGYVYAGAIGYIVRFKPQELLQHKVKGQVGLSQITVMDKPYPLQKDAQGNNTLILTPGQEFFTVDYTVLNYDNPASNRYFYKLENISNDWKETETGHLAFNNLPAGKYILHMQGSHKFGNRFTNEAVLVIQVLPYWWQTNLFKLTVTITAVALIFLVVVRRINTIKKEARLKQRIAETEMGALRSQMNPHFIFNCLNSIDNLIQNNQREKATTYLSKFAKLMRAILENSKYETIPCWKELECLQLYIDLEKLRLGDKFTSTFIVDEKIYTGDYEVPPTVLQPFVENAIHHGLLNKLDGDKTLTVTVETDGNNIKCIIKDNGVGRRQAEIYKNINNPKYHSMGVKNTTGRIHLFNDETGKPTDSIVFTDLYDNNMPCGTMVEILLKN